ncbi:MAG: zinc-ribbon domain-containing protein [Chloroflexota bacterium]|nr:zinc-ribbon domain-containing protein [Chloroflexota bacterium]
MDSKKHHRHIQLLTYMVSLITIITLFISGTDITLANGPSPTGLQNVELLVYPEYDSPTHPNGEPIDITFPNFLVILAGTIDGVEAPATVEFLVPDGSYIYSAGWIDNTGQYQRGEWEGAGLPPSEPSGIEGWNKVTFGINSSRFQMEYYHSAIEGTTDKSMLASLIPLYPIQSLSVAIMEPLASSNFAINPTSDSISEQGEFTFHHYTYETWSENETLDFDISYTKEDPDPSLTILDRPTPTNWPLIIGLSIVAVVLLGAGIYWVSRGVTEQRGAKKSIKPTASQKQSKTSHATSKPTQFCHNCGNSLDNSNRYCPNCGAEVRRRKKQ